MSLFSRILTVAVALTAGSAIASASSITIESYGSKLNNGTANTFVGSNSALSYVANNLGSGIVASPSTTTYNLPATSPWANLASNPAASWVSFNPGNYPGGSNVAAAGTYYYQSSFSAAAYSTGTITVLADDSTSVYLNTVLITPAAAAVAATNCTVGTPNCITATTFTLSGFLNGVNTLTFGVKQDFGSGTGVDFTGSVSTAATPEPSSLIFLATGLMGAAGAIRRRIKA